MAKSEETLVRDKVVAALIKSLPSLPAHNFKTVFIGIIQRLSAEEWFMAKTAAAALIPAALPLSDEGTALELANLFKGFSIHETPMVRRAAATHLKVREFKILI